MATLHVRNVPDALYEALRARAQLRGRSIGNEAIAILAENVARGVVAGTPQSFHVSGTLAREREPRERLSEPSARVLAAASYEAHALGHDAVDTEHVLLALLGEGSVAPSLQALGVDPRDLRQAVEGNDERGESSGPGPRPFAPGAKRVLERALRDALSLGEGVIGAEHILLALAADEEGVAGSVLREFGADVGTLRAARASAVTPVFEHEHASEYCAVALTGSADRWTEQLNTRAREGWQLLEVVSDAGEPRAVFRRSPPRTAE